MGRGLSPPCLTSSATPVKLNGPERWPDRRARRGLSRGPFSVPPVLRVANGKCLFDAEIADDGGSLLGPHGSPDGRDPRGVIGREWRRVRRSRRPQRFWQPSGLGIFRRVLAARIDVREYRLLIELADGYGRVLRCRAMPPVQAVHAMFDEERICQNSVRLAVVVGWIVVHAGALLVFYFDRFLSR